MKRFLILIFLFFFLNEGQAAENNGKIIMTFSEWIPMAQVDSWGNGYGLMPEIAKAVFEDELGISVGFRVRPWKRAQIDVEKGRSDFMITVATESRKRYALPSTKPFYKLPLYIYTYAGHEKLEAINGIQSAEDIKALKLIPVTNLGNGWHKDNIDAHGINTHYVGKEESILMFLASKRADIMIDAVVPTNYLIKIKELNRKIVLTKCRFSQVDFHLLLSRKSSFANRMKDINAAFERAEQKGRIQDIVLKYESDSN